MSKAPLVEELDPRSEDAVPEDAAVVPEVAATEPHEGDDLPETSLGLTAAGSLLAVAAAAWMMGGIFIGLLPRLVAVGGAVLGVGMVASSYRMSRPAVTQYLALPVGIIAGALLMLPDTSGGSANLPSLVLEAI
ncbi:MAG: hypothetical protein ACRDKT_11545, partial [Actinomycetota bacterium]